MAEKVLVVNDSPSFRRQLYWSLHEDYQVFEAQDGNEALKIVEEQRPDVLLLDLYLPPRTLGPEEGLAILKGVKERYPEIRVIIMSSSQEPDIINQTKRWGSEECLIKPFVIEELKGAIGKGLKKPTRRHWQRIEISIPVVYQYEVNFGVKDSTQTEDISLGGIMMPVSRPINRFADLNICLFLPWPVRPLEVLGQVRWTSKIEDYSSYKLGIQFIKLPKKDRSMLQRYIYV
jgi:two-component system response regulator (stage 0 sporulation protein F)